MTTDYDYNGFTITQALRTHNNHTSCGLITGTTIKA